MERTSSTHEEMNDTSATLAMAESISPVTTIVDHTGKPYGFRKFVWSGRVGICNANMTQIIVQAKPNYLYVDFLVYAKVLIAGNPQTGWDVFSLFGELANHLPPMSKLKATKLLNAGVIIY